ncbi:glucoamylase [Microlunatus capsulatus]|uniref:glucoamylase n=1 Tax=Microlunatus capsulatus TaxID=99117 RepID=UPI0035EDF253
MTTAAPAGRPRTGRPLRRALRPLALGLVVVLVYGLCPAGAASRAVRDRVVPLDALTTGVGAGGRLEPVQDAALLLPGSRVLAGAPGAAGRRRAEQAWLASGSVPAVPGLEGSTMVRDALLDLRTLALPDGVPVAAWSPPWRYVWPRDSALAAAALARTGHPADAAAVLDFLQRVQPASGVFAARYSPDGSGVPDDRGEQLDGTGWALWALAAVVEAAPAADRAALLARWAPLLDRSTAAARAAVDDGRRLPPAGPDYWEVPERRPTLATAALLRAGLAAAARLQGLADDPAAAERAGAAADRLAATVRARFGDGYPRHPGGPASSVDLGVVFLLPPFAEHADPDAVAAFARVPRAMLRPAGGLAPGGSWRDDGISWTTSTSSCALAAAALGDRAGAQAWLRWLDAHRTAAGSLPEKVLADGSPAAVAPLAWASAAVVLAAVELGP